MSRTYEEIRAEWDAAYERASAGNGTARLRSRIARAARLSSEDRMRWRHGSESEHRAISERVLTGGCACDRCDKPSASIGCNDAGVRVLCRAHTLDAMAEPASDAARDRIAAFKAGPNA